MPAPRAPVGRAATAADLPSVARCLASAFHDDPLWGAWAFPNESARRDALTRMMRAWAAAPCGTRGCA